MNSTPSRRLTAILFIDFVVLAVGGLFRSRVQAWEANLTPHGLNWVKALVLASVATFIVTVIALAVRRWRGDGKPERPDA